MGYDDIDASAEAMVPLTTVRLPIEQLAEQAWVLLQEELDKTHPDDGRPKCITVEPELIIRESTRSLK